MPFNQEMRDVFELAKYEAVEAQPDLELLDVDRPDEALFLMIASVALGGHAYSFELPADDGELETISVWPIATLDGDRRFRISIASSRPGSPLEAKIADKIVGIFKLLNDADKARLSESE